MSENQGIDYKSHYKDIEAGGGFGLAKTNFQLIKKIVSNRNKSDLRILDVGFGDGSLLKLLAKHSFNAFGIDISEKNIEKLRRETERDRVRVDVRLGDINDIPFPDKDFDIIVVAEVLEHIPDLNKSIKEISRVLKKDGSVVISVPFGQKIKYERCVNCHQLTPRDGHLHSFAKDSLSKILLQNNLETKSTRMRFSKGDIFQFLEKVYFFPFDYVIDWFDSMISKKLNIFPPWIIIEARRIDK